MKKIAVFASGTGSNFDAIVSAVRRGALRCTIALLVCDNPAAPVLQKAKKYGIPAFLAERSAFASKQDFEKAIAAEVTAHGAGLIVLAGYMRILTPWFIQQFRGKIINIHPALLPAFKGAHAIADAFAYGVKTTGVTVHFVDELTDNGPIIMQEAVPVKQSDTLATLEKRIHAAEHTVYPAAIKLVLSGKIRVTGRKTVSG